MDPIARLNRALDGRYRIERQLGEGGMATVFLASDLRHSRNVALKVLKPDLAAAVGTDRFLGEIRTTAHLQHPHILPLHDSGDADGLLFYTMPYVDGETLEQRVSREGAVPEKEAVRITTDIADALQVAHERGIIHRDIKPSNILLSYGKALVADFGIARAVGVASVSDRTRLTRTGVLIGTPVYMSPEQASGDPGIDQRADIYSLGCVLFEMLTGEPPYRGRTLLEVITKHANEPVPSVRSRRREISVGLERAVSTSLAKLPAQRFASAGEFAAALAARTPPVEAPSACTVFVLPFVNRSADPDDEYFSDGLTDEVISDLARVSALRVISRNSAMALKGTLKDTPTLARELNATHVVTGTVRRAGPALRITAELVDARIDTPIWSKKFSGSMEDVFGIQEDISRQIVSALKVRLTASESRAVAERPIDDPVAYDCYLRACQLMYDWTPQAQSQAVRLVDEAIAIVGDVPLLLAMKGQLRWNRVNTSSARAEPELTQASKLADRALGLDPDCHLAIFVRGLTACTWGQPSTGLVDLYRAHDARPGDTNILVELVRFSLGSGLRNGRRYVEQLVRLDPLSPQANLLLAMYYALYGPHSPAAAPARKSMALAPNASMLHVIAAWWIAMAGFQEEATTILGGIAKGDASDMLRALSRLLQCALEGDIEGASRVTTAEMEQAVSNEHLWRVIADGYALLGRRHDALRAIQTAVRFGFLNYPNLTAADSFLQNLKNDPEFEALIAQIKPRWQALIEWERGRG